MIKLDNRGSYRELLKDLDAVNEVVQNSSNFDKYGKAGVRALSRSTPSKTGKTADSWKFRVVKTATTVSIQWYNTNTPNGVPLALILRYGHATRGGGYVNGKDYITPAMRPLFVKLLSDVRKEVADEFK
jgi:hypothetical protein